MTFTASNGVELDKHGHWVDGSLIAADVHAARMEFYQYLRDKELGRWRWPENPDFTVREAPEHARHFPEFTVAIERESTGYVGYYTRDRLPEITDKTGDIVRAGHAYFDAHPERKPWDDAKPGEVWLLTVDGKEQAALIAWDGEVYITDESLTPGTAESNRITAGRRIWPEAS